jgi:16S rRNA (adenine1518-N6/adenine1519-N6)-dimethyltransferase
MPGVSRGAVVWEMQVRMSSPVHRPRRRFGQNFLVDRSFIARIVEAIAPQPDDQMVEIGPGQGALTTPLLQRLNRLDVVEIDRDLAAALAARFPPERLRVHACDALEFDFCALGGSLRVVGNLPYNVSSPLLFHLAECTRCLRDCHFMLQLEVVERMAAQPGGKTYGRLSVMIQYRFAVEKLFRVPAGAFRPVPKVESALVRLTPKPAGALRATDEHLLGALVAGAFSQRRKTLRNAVSAWLTAAQIQAAGADPGARPETLSLEQFVRLADTAAAIRAGRVATTE